MKILMYQTGRSERCIYNVLISRVLDSRLQVNKSGRTDSENIKKYLITSFSLSQEFINCKTGWTSCPLYKGGASLLKGGAFPP